MGRYQVSDGIVIRRVRLPSGDLVATLLSEHGTWRGVARKGKLIGGNLGRLSLFHDVTVQHYRRRDDDLPVLVQVQLNGALPRLSDPAVYPFAHLLAELADALTVDVHLGERMYEYLASGLRGLASHADPEAVALIYAWRLLQQAGLGPRTLRCARCGDAAPPVAFDAAAGGLLCAACAGSGAQRIGAAAADTLRTLASRPIRSALANPPAADDRPLQWRLLDRWIAYHVGSLRSAPHLPHLERSLGGHVGATARPSPGAAPPDTAEPASAHRTGRDVDDDDNTRDDTDDPRDETSSGVA